MIQSVTVTNYLGESIEMKLRNPEESGFLIFGIDGLGPTKADINMTQLVSSDGGLFNSSRANSRNIVLAITFSDVPDVETNRLRSYKYFPIKKPVRLKIKTDAREGEIVGYVESNEPAIFSQKAGTAISIVCPSAYFSAPEKNIVMFSGITSLFEFPFENASLTENLIEMSAINNLTEKAVVYDGDSETGLVLYMHANGAVGNPKIINTNTLGSIGINSERLEALTGSGIIAGDDIIISTIRGEKFVSLYRDGVKYNILNTLEQEPEWFELQRGDNIFAFVADTGTTNLQIRIENSKLYEGM